MTMVIDLDNSYLERLFSDFPRLDATPLPFVPTSKACVVYNCFAWALEIDDRPVDHFHWWPVGCKRHGGIPAYLHCFSVFGYEPCTSSSLEEGCVKIALYAKDGMASHAARQLTNGKWTSKLGKMIDLEHELEDLEGECYGKVLEYLRRASDLVVDPLTVLSPHYYRSP